MGQSTSLASDEAIWAGVMLIVGIALFIAAAVIGPLVPILMPPDDPPAADPNHHTPHPETHRQH